MELGLRYSVWVKVHEILIFGSSAFYLNIMFEVHNLDQNIFYNGEDFVKMRNSEFKFKI